MDMIYKQGGTSKMLMETEEFRECFMPVIRADYILLDEKKLIHHKGRFPVKAVIFNGEEDVSARENEEQLKAYFEGKVPVVHFKGGHFYFEHQVPFVCEQINNYIEKCFGKVFEHAIDY